MDQYQEFVGKLQKRGSKPHKISHCLGSRDAFHWVRKNHWEATGGKPIDKQLYSQIISEIHKVLVEAFLEGHEIEFPYQMGSLVLTRTPSKVFYEDGELKTRTVSGIKGNQSFKDIEIIFCDDGSNDNSTKCNRLGFIRILYSKL